MVNEFMVVIYDLHGRCQKLHTLPEAFHFCVATEKSKGAGLVGLEKGIWAH